MRNFAGDLAKADRCDVRRRGRSTLPVLAALVVIGRTWPPTSQKLRQFVDEPTRADSPHGQAHGHEAPAERGHG
jgi:hypothetical protein